MDASTASLLSCGRGVLLWSGVSLVDSGKRGDLELLPVVFSCSCLWGVLGLLLTILCRWLWGVLGLLLTVLCPWGVCGLLLMVRSCCLWGVFGLFLTMFLWSCFLLGVLGSPGPFLVGLLGWLCTGESDRLKRSEVVKSSCTKDSTASRCAAFFTNSFP